MTRLLLACYLLLAALLAGPAQAQNVGIGTSAPTQALDVNGQVQVRGLAGNAAGRLLGLAADGTLQAQAPAFSGAVPAAFAQPTGQVVAATSGSPVGVVVNPAGTRAFVISDGGNTLETFDLSGAGAPRKIGSLGLITYYGTRALKLNQAGTRLYVLADVVMYTFDVSSGLPVRLAVNTVITSTNEVVVDAAATAVYVLASGYFVRFTLTNNGVPSSVPYSSALLNTPSSGSPYKMALNAAGTRLYMLVREAAPTPSRLYLFDVSTAGIAVILGSVPVSGVPEALVLNAASTRAYVVSSGSNTLETFDLSGALPVSLGTVPTGNAPADVALNAAGTRLYVPNTGDNILQIYDVSGAGLPVSLAANPTGMAPRAVATALVGTRLYVANSGNQTLQVFDQQNQPRPLAVSAGGAAGSLGAVALPGAGRLPATYGTVSSGGAAAGSGGAFSVTHSATGVYRLSFSNSPLSTTDLGQATVVAALAGVAPGSVSYRTGPGYVEILTYAPGGAAFDRSFTFSVALP